MKITLLLEYPETANPQFGAGMELHGGKVEVVQFGDLFAEQEAHEQKADLFTPRAWHCPHCGMVVPGGTYHDCKEETMRAKIASLESAVAGAVKTERERIIKALLGTCANRFCYVTPGEPGFEPVWFTESIIRPYLEPKP